MPLNTAKLIKKTNSTNDVIELNFETASPLNFKAGQYISIRIDNVEKSAYFRAYSIATRPEKDGKKFGLCIKVLTDSRGSGWLNSLKKNDKISFLGPLGDFTFNENSDKDVIFVATGTGIAPLKAIIEDQLHKNSSRKMTLILGLRHISGVFYKEYFEKLTQKYPNFQFTLTLSRPENNSWHGKKGRVTDILASMKLSPTNTEFYLCGLKNMIESVGSLLKEKGIKEEDIHFEKYD